MAADPPVTKESARLTLQFDDANAIDALFQAALAEKHGEAFFEYVRFMGKFNRFSIFNAMLIRVQRPGATVVGTRFQWEGIGRSVNRDAVPIVILRPFGPVQFVYEISDTSGEPVPGDRDLFAATGDVKKATWDRTVAAAMKCGITIEETTSYGAALAGTAATTLGGAETETVDGKEPGWRIRINEHLDRASKFATLAHELGHIYCGHLGPDSKDRWRDRSASLLLTPDAQELEAEAAAYIVCQRVGIETNSVEYLAPYINDALLCTISAYAILAAANRIEARSD